MSANVIAVRYPLLRLRIDGWGLERKWWMNEDDDMNK